MRFGTTGQVFRARTKQIMNLLAPDIQEQPLDLIRIAEGDDPIGERLLRRVLRETDGNSQGWQLRVSH